MTRARWWMVGAAVIGTMGAEQLVHHEYDYWFTGIPGFFVLFGFIGCAAIVYLSKWFGRLFVQRDEDYYALHGDEDPHGTMSTPRRAFWRGDSGRPRSHTPTPPREES